MYGSQSNLKIEGYFTNKTICFEILAALFDSFVPINEYFYCIQDKGCLDKAMGSKEDQNYYMQCITKYCTRRWTMV